MPRLNQTHSKKNTALLLYKQGWSIADIAIHLHTTQEWVKTFIHEYNQK